MSHYRTRAESSWAIPFIYWSLSCGFSAGEAAQLLTLESCQRERYLTDWKQTLRSSRCFRSVSAQAMGKLCGDMGSATAWPSDHLALGCHATARNVSSQSRLRLSPVSQSSSAARDCVDDVDLHGGGRLGPRHTS
ncbi:hypothetical protein BV20DRAFT_763526 [Pilatotrama ljubarskyi]|nr:hypothetical protein BV20DRAFT_763526 [Pilatotrama ljubarskyi]